jgi:hypothetical protein
MAQGSVEVLVIIGIEFKLKSSGSGEKMDVGFSVSQRDRGPIAEGVLSHFYLFLSMTQGPKDQK